MGLLEGQVGQLSAGEVDRIEGSPEPTRVAERGRHGRRRLEGGRARAGHMNEARADGSVGAPKGFLDKRLSSEQKREHVVKRGLWMMRVTRRSGFTRGK